MAKSIKKILELPEKYYLLGIATYNDITSYCLIELLYKNNELKIINRCQSNSFDESFKSNLGKEYPVILHVETDSIISKKVKNSVGYQNNLIFKSDPNDFHFFEYHQEDEVFISVARKNIIRQVISEICENNLYVIHLTLGPFVLANIIPLVKNYSQLATSAYALSIHSSQLLSFKRKTGDQEQFLINDEKFSGGEMPLIASFLDYKFQNKAIEFDTSFLKSQKVEFKYKKWFKTALVASIIFLLSSILIGHLLLNSYRSKLAEKETIYGTSQQTILKINLLKEEKKLKEKILQTSGIINKSFITRYMSDIGNSTPNNVKLISITGTPTLKKIKPDAKILFDFNAIEIIGEAANDHSFNDWIKKVKMLGWVEKLEIIDYAQERTKVNSFKIKITT